MIRNQLVYLVDELVTLGRNALQLKAQLLEVAFKV